MNRFARNILLIACCSGMGVAQLSYAITVKVWNTSNIVGNTVFYEMHYANDLQGSNLITLDTKIIKKGTKDELYPLIQSLLPPPPTNAADQGPGPFREIVVSAAAVEACKQTIKNLDSQTLFAHPVTAHLQKKYGWTPVTLINSGQRVKDTLTNELDKFLNVVNENWLQSGILLKITPTTVTATPQLQATLDDNFSPLAQPFRNIYFALGELGKAFGFSLIQPTLDQGLIQKYITSPFQKHKKVMFWTALATSAAIGGLLYGPSIARFAGPYAYSAGSSAGSYVANAISSKFSTAAPAAVPKPMPAPVAPVQPTGIVDALKQGWRSWK
jgi:hypothetical protein